MTHRSIRSLAPALAAAGFLAVTAAAQERLQLGTMWTFERPPISYLEQEYGVKPTQEWLDRLRLASVRFGNWCSSSFVSPKGLVMTNHHCVRDKIAQAQARHSADWVKDGFYAKAYEDEVRLDELHLSQLRGMRDVTADIDQGIAAGDDEQTITKKRAANEEKVLAKAREENPDLVPQVVKMHHGAAFVLYLYKEFRDVRLVMAPHLAIAHFGGDPDNFTFPRYSIDFAFVRVWDGDKPADTSAHYFRWSTTGPKDGELVFVTGNPGSTGRQLTVAQMEHARDAEYPLQLDQLDTQLESLKDAARDDPSFEPRVRTTVLQWENAQKAIRGYLRGLRDPSLMGAKQKAETALRERVAADPKLAERFGGVWEKLESVARRKTALLPRLTFQQPGYSQILVRAVAIANATDASRPERERAAARRQALEFQFRGGALQERLLRNAWTLAEKWLGADDPMVTTLLAGGHDAALAKLRASKVKDQDFVRELVDGGAEAVAASDDFAVVVGRVLSEVSRKSQAEMRELVAAEEALAAKVGQALYAAHGDMMSPDATMTLRFSDGVVSGYPCNGTLAPWRTTFHGLYARTLEFDGRHPWDLPEVWREREDRVELTRAVNFVSTNDIIGGNSGSPVVDKELRVVGLIFDSNIDQLANRFLYRSKTQRSVSVHVHAIEEALVKMYDAAALLAELHGTPAPEQQPPAGGKKDSR